MSAETQLIEGLYFDGSSSRALPCTLHVDATGNARLLCDGDVQQQATYSQLKISSRLGNTPRYLQFPCGGQFETRDNSAVDHWQRHCAPSLLTGLAYQLESHKRFVLLGVLVVLFTLWGAVKYLIPLASEWVAWQLPATIPSMLGQQTLQLLDLRFLQPSQLPEPRQQELQHLFNNYFAPQQQALGVRLHFRAGNGLGANALALPSGDLIFTDAIVTGAGNNMELLSVMAHEVGHIHYRHMMRRLIQDSLLVFTITLATGDVSSVSGAVIAAPLTMLELAYSRKFEMEADSYAREFMLQHQVDLVHFSNMMQRLEWLELEPCRAQSPHMATESGPGSMTPKIPGREEKTAEILSDVQHYLSTHPLMADRIKHFGAPTVAKEEVMDNLPACETVVDSAAE